MKKLLAGFIELSVFGTAGDHFQYLGGFTVFGFDKQLGQFVSFQFLGMPKGRANAPVAEARQHYRLPG